MEAPSLFGARLRHVRTEQGISLAGLSERTHYSKGYLSKLETGAKPASADLARRLDEVLGTGGALIELVEAERRPVCPYRGLEPFGAADEAWFFGRGEATTELVEAAATAEAAGRLLLVVGPSGVGKSSLVRAGLLPVLARSGRVVETRTPTAAPAAGPGSTGGVLFVDQFEELFTLCEAEADRRAFVAALAARARAGLVVLSLRADFYGRCLAYPELLEASRAGQVTVGPMSPAQLRAAITGPADAAGLTLEPGLVELLLADVGPTAAGTLPLLSHALLATWQEREDSTLTVAGYRRAGGIDGAVSSTAEEAFASLDADEQDAARRLLLRLVRVGEHEEDTRRPVHRGALLRQLPAQAATALQDLTTARLLTVDAETASITHEALLHAWPRLRGWIDADRESLRVHHRLTEAAETWDGEDHDPALLVTGSRLAVAADWAADHDDQLSAVERDFLAASRAAAEATALRERRHTRRLRLLVTGLAVLTVLVAVAASIAVVQSQAAGRERDQAVSRELATEADQLLLTDPGVATQLGLAAYRAADTPQARGSLIGASGTPAVTRFKAHPGSITDLAFLGDGRTLVTAGLDGTTRFFTLAATGAPVPHAVLRAGAESVTGLAVAPRRALLATADEDQATRLWSTSSIDRPALLGTVPGTGQASALAFDAAGTLLAIGRDDGGVELWDVTDPARPVHRQTFAAHQKTVRSLAFSPTAPVLLSGGDDTTGRLWDVTGAAAPLAVFATHTATVRTVAISADGTTAAVGSDDRIVALWSIADRAHPTLLRELTGDTNAIRGLAFAPDGRTVATASDDQTVRLWNTADAGAVTSVSQPAPARSAVFSSDGTVLATGNDLGELWLWHLPPPSFADRDGTTNVAYDPHRPQLAIGADDGRVHLHALADRREIGVLDGGPGLVRIVAYHPRLPILAVAGDDRVTRLWDVADPAHPRVLASLGAVSTVYNAVFRSDGGLLALVGTDHDVTLWDTTDPARPEPLPAVTGHTNAVNGLAFSPDGRLLATGSDDYSSRIWDVSNPRAPRFLARLADHSNGVTAVAFAPDGTTLATASEDHTVHLLDVRDPAHPVQLAELTGPSAPVTMVTFSPDGHLLATADDDATARVWDVTDRAKPQQLAELTGHAGPVNAVAFSPDGRQIATTGDDHTARLWSTDADDVAARICSLAGQPLSPAEWARYVPDRPQENLCP